MCVTLSSLCPPFFLFFSRADVPSEVQLCRGVIRLCRNALRQDIIPSRLLHHLHSLPIEEEEAIIAEEMNHGATRSADIMLNSLVRQKGPQWYRELVDACRDEIVKLPHLADLLETRYSEEKIRWCGMGNEKKKKKGKKRP